MAFDQETVKRVMSGLDLIGSFLGYGVLGQAISSARQKFGGAAAGGTDKSPDKSGSPDKDKLAADPFGMGLDDETLFWGAVALAFNLKMLTQEQIEKNLAGILHALKPNPHEVKRFYQMIGRKDSEITIRVPDGKGGESDVKTVGNIRGALILQFLCSMPANKAVKMLRDSKTLTGVKDDLDHIFKIGKDFFGNIAFQESLFKLIGVASLKELQQKNEAAERKLQTRKNQFWMEWLWPAEGFGWTLYVAVGGLTGLGLIISFFATAPK